MARSLGKGLKRALTNGRTYVYNYSFNPLQNLLQTAKLQRNTLSFFGKKETVGSTTAIDFFSSSLLEGFLHVASSRSNSFHLSRMKKHVHTNNIPNSQICAKIAATATFHYNTQKFSFARPPFRDWRIWSSLHSTAGWASHDRKGNVSWTNYLPCWSSL